MPDPLDRPSLRRPELLRAIAAHGVDWVLSGSIVLALHGARITPNDLDLVPDPDPANLARLCALLDALQAIPAYVPEWKELTLEQCRAWRAAPDLATLDHLFVTTLGLLDVPPTITGTYAHLGVAATWQDVDGVPIRVCDPREVLARLPAKPRAKDLDRAAEYDAVRRRLQAPTP